MYMYTIHVHVHYTCTMYLYIAYTSDYGHYKTFKVFLIIGSFLTRTCNYFCYSPSYNQTTLSVGICIWLWSLWKTGHWWDRQHCHANGHIIPCGPRYFCEESCRTFRRETLPGGHHSGGTVLLGRGGRWETGIGSDKVIN